MADVAVHLASWVELGDVVEHEGERYQVESIERLPEGDRIFARGTVDKSSTYAGPAFCTKQIVALMWPGRRFQEGLDPKHVVGP